MNKSLTKYILAILVSSFATAAIATSIPNNSSNPKTFLGPTAHLGVTRAMSDNTAFSVAGEAGPRNLRLGGTIGWELTYYQRLKASAELLRQKITYSFFDGRQSPWLNQGAFGLDYQYDFHETAPFNTQLDLAGYVSHSPSKSLGIGTGTFIQNGVVTPYTVDRRIAGANAAGISPGVTFSPWYGTSTNLRLNYDNVRYDTNYRGSESAKGLGGTVRIDQMIVENVNLGVSAAVRQPFNNYEADIAWGNIPYYGLWTVKLFGAYTIGKESLPTTYNVGIGADYLIGADNPMPQPVAAPLPAYKDQPVANRQFKDKVVYKDAIIPPVEWEERDNVNKDLLQWTSTPAVYMPQVLGITDQNLCVAPTLVSAIPDQGTVVSPPYTFDVAPFFNGTNLTFKVNNAPAGNGSISGSIVSINNTTSDLVNISITASNECGSVTSNLFTAFT